MSENGIIGELKSLLKLTERVDLNHTQIVHMNDRITENSRRFREEIASIRDLMQQVTDNMNLRVLALEQMAMRDEPVTLNKPDPAPGTFMWAVEQWRVGNPVRRRCHSTSLFRGDGGYIQNGMGVLQGFCIADFTAVDWEIVYEKGSE